MMRSFVVQRRWFLLGITSLVALVICFLLNAERYVSRLPQRKSFERYQGQMTRSYKTKIPKIIHQIWNEEIIPDQFIGNIKSLIKYNPHPEWQYRFWTLDQGRQFIEQTFPTLLPIYDGSHLFTKPDILRILVIYHYGGAYFDLDVFGVRPLDRFVELHECAVSGPVFEHLLAYDMELDPLHVNNAIFLCRPHHPFFHELFARTEERSKLCKNLTCPMPEFPYPLLVDLKKQGLTDSMPEIVKDKYFEPIYDLTVTTLLEEKCSGLTYDGLEPERKIVCDEWRRNGKDLKTIPESSYTVHTWFHTGINPVTKLENRSISSIVPHVQLYKVAKRS